MQEKKYDPTSKRILHFAVGKEEKLKKFTGKEPSDFKIVNDSILGRAYEVPFRINYKKAWER